MRVSWLGIALLCGGLLCVAPASSEAVAIDLLFTIDEPTHGRAVLSGSIDDTFEHFKPATAVKFDSAGIWWQAIVELSQFSGDFPPPTGRLTGYNLNVTGRHLKRPAGAEHKGEVDRGLLLGGGGKGFYTNISGLDPYEQPGSPDRADWLIHPGSTNHYDFMFSHFDDLNGNAAGFLTADRQLSVRIDFFHAVVPEPSTIVLIGLGLIAAAGWAWKRRRRRA